MALISYIGPYYLLDFEYLLQYEVGINVFFYAIGQVNWNSGIPVDILVHFNKIKFKAGRKDNL